jgi:triosephosphate isomerase
MNKLIIANWKATKGVNEAVEWTKVTRESLEKIENLEVVICPSFVCLPFISSIFKDTNIKVGAQDVSKFPPGAYTGEVTATMLDGLADYCIVGHSERRKNFKETNEDVNEKIKQLGQNGIKSVVCVSKSAEVEALEEVAHDISVVAYEPLFAIGSDKPDTPENAAKFAQDIKAKLPGVRVIYGGSVDPGNLASFLAKEDIDGVLPGRASWDPDTFLELLNSAH